MTHPPTIAISFLLFFQIFFTYCITSYTPDDNFLVNCDSSGNSPSLDGRNWTGDINSMRFSPIELSSSSVKALGKTIPYDTARLSRFEFSYSFPVKTEGQKFIRLYFYPYSYDPNFLRFDSFFSVRVGSHTLLKDFNASITADDAGVETIVLEYCVDIVYASEELISITFTPSLSHPNAYAFINGIEVVSMPTFLYYINPNNLQGMMLDGGTQQYAVKSNRVLETMYRINVGGRQISPKNDTGMFRSWESDVMYLDRERSQSISAGFGLKPIYRDYQNYSAPDEVYMTARNYGAKETSKFNVTWEFQVDSVFMYMVRLHFCDFDQHIEKPGDRIFQIFINDNLVESVADLMLWTQNQILVPIHRDYAVSMPISGSLKKLNLSIKLQPHPTARST